MALVSRHSEIVEAVKASIVLDADIVAAIPEANWRVQKQPFNRFKPWVAGARICPVRRSFPVHENRVHRIVCPVLVSISWPSDSDLTDELEQRMAVIERIEEMFAYKGQTLAPSPMVALTSLHTGNDAYAFEQTIVQPGDPFIEAAFNKGFDALAVVIEVYISKVKRSEA